MTRSRSSSRSLWRSLPGGRSAARDSDTGSTPFRDELSVRHLARRCARAPPTGIVIRDRTAAPSTATRRRRLAGTHAGLIIDEAIEHHLQLGRWLDSKTARSSCSAAEDGVRHPARPLPHGHSVAFVDDISERRRVEQTRTDFVANISHELKTLVGALSVLAETLIEETDSTRSPAVVTRMLAETDRGQPHDRRSDGAVPHRDGSRALGRACSNRRGDPGRCRSLTELGRRDGITISSLTTVETDARQADAPPSSVTGASSRVGCRQPGRERRQVQRARWLGAGSRPACRRLDRDQRRRPGRRHPATRPRPCLRALLPRRLGAQPDDRRHGSRPGDRAPRLPATTAATCRSPRSRACARSCCGCRSASRTHPRHSPAEHQKDA